MSKSRETEGAVETGMGVSNRGWGQKELWDESELSRAGRDKRGHSTLRSSEAKEKDTFREPRVAWSG